MSANTDFLVARLGHVDLDVVDLDEATDFYEDVLHLEVSDRRDGVVFLRGDRTHHWLRLDQATTPGVQRVAYQAVDDAAFDEIKRRLDSHGIGWEEGGDLTLDRIDRRIRFRDPDGFEIEIFDGMAELAFPTWQRFVEFESFSHAVLFVSDVVASEHFYREVLGFRPSDWGERSGVFLHCADLGHHSLALIAGDRPGTLDHVCFNLETLDDVMRARAHAMRRGVELRLDILRHGGSGSIGVYLRDPFLGIGLEFCTGHGRVDPEHHRPRVLLLALPTVDVWQAPPPRRRRSGPDGDVRASLPDSLRRSEPG